MEGLGFCFALKKRKKSRHCATESGVILALDEGRDRGPGCHPEVCGGRGWQAHGDTQPQRLLAHISCLLLRHNDLQ